MGQGSAKNCCGKGSRQKVTKVKHYYILGERGVSKFFRKSVGGDIKLKVTSFLDGPLFRPRAKNGGFQLVRDI